MIEIQMTGICEGCNKADLILSDIDQCVFTHNWRVYCKKEDACKRVEMLCKSKAEEAEQKKGHWIPVDDPSITGRCSVCGFESHLCEDDVYGYDYCPNCGARLEVVEE